MTTKRYLWKRVKGKKNTLHRFIMEEKLGRPLTSQEHVYHIDGDAKNNEIENLVVIVKNPR